MNRKETQNNFVFLRPRFAINCDRNHEAVLETVYTNIEKINDNHKVKISENHFFIDVPIEDAHFWSPQLHFQIEKNEKETIIKGLFSPKPQVWTLFMFVHFVVAILFMGFSVLFYVKYKLGSSVIFPTIMLVILPVLWFFLYLLGQLGKEKGNKQMDELKEFMKSVLENVQY